MSHLTEKNESFCSITGFTGLGLSITCLLQSLYFANGMNWIVATIDASYMLSIVSFLLLIKKSRHTTNMLIANTIFLFLVNILFLITLAFSPVALLLLLFSVVILVLIYINGLPKKLYLHALDKKAEENYWNDKV